MKKVKNKLSLNKNVITTLNQINGGVAEGTYPINTNTTCYGTTCYANSCHTMENNCNSIDSMRCTFGPIKCGDSILTVCINTH